MGWKVGLLAALVLLPSACTATEFFTCEESSQCAATDGSGTCQATGFCSFPDPECDSGQRYGGLAGSLSNLCVDAAPSATEASTGPSTTTTTTFGPSTSSGSTSAAPTTGGSESSSTTGTTTPITASETGPGMPTGDSSSSATTGSLEEGLLGWWPLDDDPTDGVFDASSSGNDGTCVEECPVLTPDGFYHFDGTQIVVIPGDDFDAPEFTISLWVRPEATHPRIDPIVFTKPVGVGVWNSWGLHYAAGFDDFEFVIGNPDENTATDLEDVETDNWHHYAGRFDGSTATLFLDGSATTSTVIADGYFVVDEHNVYLGGDFDEGGPPDPRYAGDLADVRYYDRPLSSEEIAALAADRFTP